jgi:hypothetical protein
LKIMMIEVWLPCRSATILHNNCYWRLSTISHRSLTHHSHLSSKSCQATIAGLVHWYSRYFFISKWITRTPWPSK